MSNNSRVATRVYINTSKMFSAPSHASLKLSNPIYDYGNIYYIISMIVVCLTIGEKNEEGCPHKVHA